MTEKEITIIVVAYKRYKAIHTVVWSFLNQTLDNWKMVIIHDGSDERMREELRPYLEKYDHIEYRETKRRYNNWGHSLRAIALNDVDTRFVMFTNDDNYYVPVFLERMFQEIRPKGKEERNFVFCDMVHSHLRYQVLSTALYSGTIDIGCFIVRTQYAQQVGFRKFTFDADAQFVGDYLEQRVGRDMQLGKVEQVLFVHN